MPIKAALLPECASPQGPSVNLRRRTRPGSRDRQDRGLPDLALSAQKDRDAVRPPQTHPETRPAKAARALRRPRRIPPRRHRPEPAQAGQAHPRTAADPRWVREEHKSYAPPLRAGATIVPQPSLSFSTQSSPELPSPAARITLSTLVAAGIVTFGGDGGTIGALLKFAPNNEGFRRARRQLRAARARLRRDGAGAAPSHGTPERCR